MQQLHFNEIHGNNLVLKNNKSIARRLERFGNGVSFTNRPVTIGECIQFRITETSEKSSGILQIGFTSTNPSNMPEELLDNLNFILHSNLKIWTGSLNLSFSKECVVSFYVNNDGFIYYIINNGEKTKLFSRVDTLCKLWAIINVAGKIVEIELLNSAFSRLDFNEMILKKASSQDVSFHQVHGSNISLSDDRTIAYKNNSTSHFTYVFSNNALNFNEKIIIKVNKLWKDSKGTLDYGLTTNDPSEIPPIQLPEHTGDVFKFPDYWISYKDRKNYKTGDILIFIITFDGKFIVLKNCSTRTCFLQVDIKRPLWLFIKLSGAISEISIKELSAKNYCDVMAGCVFKVDSLQETGEEFGSYACASSIVSSTSVKECLICWKKPVNCVIYCCGHMCMCFECARAAYYHKELRFCPVCKTIIQDVMKTY